MGKGRVTGRKVRGVVFSCYYDCLLPLSHFIYFPFLHEHDGWYPCVACKNCMYSF